MTRGREILGALELSQYIGIHPLTLKRYARTGKIPAFKVGATWKFERRQIRKWLSQRKRAECPLILKEN